MNIFLGIIALLLCIAFLVCATKINRDKWAFVLLAIVWAIIAFLRFMEHFTGVEL